MTKLYIVDINGVPTVIEETIPEGQRQAQWKIIRSATIFDADIPQHHYFTMGVVSR